MGDDDSVINPTTSHDGWAMVVQNYIIVPMSVRKVIL